jgi:hypothetical protein
MIARLFLLFALAALSGCATPMSRGQCGVSHECTLSGTLSPVVEDGVEMGRMDLASGDCVAVSLPDGMVNRLFASGPYATTVHGRVFDDPAASNNQVQIDVNGGPVGSGMCGGDFFVFVY